MKLFKFFVLALFIIFTSCEKESLMSSTSTISSDLSKDVSVTSSRLEESPNQSVVGRYIHNGVEIDPETIDWSSDNVEMYYNYENESEDEILVFFTSEEASAWLSTLPDEAKSAISKSRNYRKRAREIAIQTDAVIHFDLTGEISSDYESQMNGLWGEIYDYNQEPTPESLGFLYSGLFSGQTLPVLGLLGYPVLWQLDKNLNSVKTVGLTSLHTFCTKRFYFGNSPNCFWLE